MELNKLFKKQLIKTGQITENINDSDFINPTPQYMIR